MQVIVLVKANEESEAGKMPSQELMDEMMKFNKQLMDAGIFVTGAGLEQSSKGKRINFRSGGPLVIDGPFAETKELVSGFWIWKVDSFEQALDWAKRAPFHPSLNATIEVRAVRG